MATVSRTLQRACDGVLREVIDQLVNGEVQRLGNKTVNLDTVVLCYPMLNRAMVSVEIVALGDEAVCKGSVSRLLWCYDHSPRD